MTALPPQAAPSSLPDGPPASRRHFLPSIPATVFVGVLCFVMFGFQEPLLNSDGDLARHLRHGEYMLQHHALIRADPFSFTRPGQPFVGFEYGSQLIYTLVHRLGGLAAVTVFASLLIASAYALLSRYMIRRGVEPLFAGLVVAAAMISGMGHWVARPHLVTMVAVVILLELLAPLGKRRLWPFVPLFAIWTNLHGGFSYGLIVVGMYLAGAMADAALDRDRSRRADVRFFAAALALATASTLLHPRAIAVYRHIIGMFADKYIINHTGEFLSPDFHDSGSKLFLVVMLIAIGAAALSRRRLSRTATIVLVVGIYFALTHQRNATLFGLTALPLMAVELDSAWRRFGMLRGLRTGFEAASRGAATAAWVMPACALAIGLSLTHGRLAGRHLLADRFSAKVFPVQAVEQARAAGLSGRIFSDFAWGGYLLYAWPEQKVFIDGGTDFYGGKLMRQYAILYEDLPGWRSLVQSWDFSVLLLRPTAPLASEIMQGPGWRYWYCDATAVVLVRTAAGRTAPPPSPAFSATACTPPPRPRAAD